MIGLIMAGGASTRMGTDKGLMLESQGQTWVKKAHLLLQDAGLSTFISLNRSQELSYLKFFSPEILYFDDTSLPVMGPLKGLLSVHIAKPQEDIFALATDLPKITLSQIERLICFKEANPEHDAWIYIGPRGPEPLCAIYSSNCLARISANPPAKFSLMGILDLFRSAYLPINDHELLCFENFNYPKLEK
jgi:molybdopterin-guanine dinucleotide biosynthesis protein A